MTTAYLTHPRFKEHTLAGHVEHAGRLEALDRAFAESGVLGRLAALEPRPASDDELRRVHLDRYLGTLLWSASRKQVTMFGPDTYALPTSFEVARLSAGAALRAVEAVLDGEANNALVAARPPGHHATPDRAMGFCLLANAALAARHAQAIYGLGRVLIVDYDVHHGNGTQDAFYDDPAVLFISTHQSPLYPGTGALDETGFGPGLGATINVPLRPGHGDASFAAIYEQVVWPAARRFQPELILVSAGYDAHWADPLGGLTLMLPGFAHLGRELVHMAEELCEGRIAFLLEGGYNLDAVAHGMLNTAYVLLGEDTVSDPLGEPRSIGFKRLAAPQDVAPLLAQVRRVHGL